MGLLPPGTELSPRPEWVPAWDSLPPEQQQLYARYQECFAAYLSHADHHVGRVLAFLEELGELDNTLVFALSDNGASSEGGETGSINDARPWNLAERPVEEAIARIDEIGGPTVHNNYPWGWTVAGNTPFRRWKREVHEGGIADPLVVSWPARLTARGEIRRQYVHAIDLVPTILEVAGVTPPSSIDGAAQTPIHGVSFAESLFDAGAVSRRDTQYYEMFACRAIYHGGWKAVVYHPIADISTSLDDDAWELYHVDEDASECHDLAARHPEILRELVERWWIEAAKYKVLPVDPAPFGWLYGEEEPAHTPRAQYVYYPIAGPVTEEAAVNVRNRSHTITADVELHDADVEGMLLAQGSMFGGYAFYVRGRRLHYVHNFGGLHEYRVSSDAELTGAERALAFRFEKTHEHRGIGTLVIDGQDAGSVEIERFTPTRFSITGEGLCCGYDMGMPVTNDYRPPFRFTGTLHKVVVDVEGAPFVDPAAEAEQAIRTQ